MSNDSLNQQYDPLDALKELEARVDKVTDMMTFACGELRSRLWLGHGHHGQYGDDGEMQCVMCYQAGYEGDYKRGNLRNLVRQVSEMQLAGIQTAVDRRQRRQKLHDDIVWWQNNDDTDATRLYDMIEEVRKLLAEDLGVV